MSGNRDRRTEKVLQNVAQLLSEQGFDEWARHFRNVADDFSKDPRHFRNVIRRCYGSMGSFNDVVFSSHNRGALIEENNQLSLLRQELYELVQEVELPEKPE